MARYRKKPIVIEALGPLSHDNIEDIREWCNGTLASGPITKSVMGITIKTEEGDMLASWGDYIIRGVEGEFYPCKPDIFHKTYEIVHDFIAEFDKPVVNKCSCLACRPITMHDMRFAVCSQCGNKRCPHCQDHRYRCTNSNEPGQVGELL